MGALHSKKIEAEKNAYLNSLQENLPDLNKFLGGDLNTKAKTFHKALLPIYIMKHYSKGIYLSGYLDIVITNIIESESLLFLGFQNSGFSALRGAIESVFKFLYYEYHPVERMLHQDDKHALTIKEYREFAYLCPFLKNLSYFSREIIEGLWVNLCRYVHCDIKTINKMTLVSNISISIFEDEHEYAKLLDTYKTIAKIIVTIFFSIDRYWAKNVEKAYFDAILEAFTVSEQRELRENVGIC